MIVWKLKSVMFKSTFIYKKYGIILFPLIVLKNVELRILKRTVQIILCNIEIKFCLTAHTTTFAHSYWK